MITIKRSLFPLSKISVKIDDNQFYLNTNGMKNINSNNLKEGKYTIEVSSYWIVSRKEMILHSNSKIKILSSIPDLYYIFGGSIVLVLCLLTFLNLVHPILLGIVNLIYVIPIIYYSFFNIKNYFKIYNE